MFPCCCTQLTHADSSTYLLTLSLHARRQLPTGVLDTVGTTGEWLWTSVLFLRMRDGKGTQGEKQRRGTSVTISSHHTLILGWPQMSSRWLDGLRCSKTGGDLSAGMGRPAAWPLGGKMAKSSGATEMLLNKLRSSWNPESLYYSFINYILLWRVPGHHLSSLFYGASLRIGENTVLRKGRGCSLLKPASVSTQSTARAKWQRCGPTKLRNRL